MSQPVPSTDPVAKARADRLAHVSRVMDPATYGLSGAPLSTPAAVNRALTVLRSAGVNLIGPEVHMDLLPRNHVVSLRMAFFDRWNPTPTGPSGKMGNGTWYQQQGGGLSPASGMLFRVAGLTGLEILSCEMHEPHGPIPLYWRYRVAGRVKIFDGTTRVDNVDVPYDLRDSSPEIAVVKGKDANSVADQVAKMRAKGAQRAETFAKERLIRALLGLDQKYSEEAADMPFVWPSLVYVRPESAELDRLESLREIGALHALYGGRREVIDVSPVDRPQLAAPVDGVDFAAENARLDRERAARVPAYADPDEEPDEMPEFGAAPSAPAEDSNARTWSGYTLAEVRDFFAANDRPDPSTAGPDQRAQICAWLAAAGGKRQIDGFLAAMRAGR